MLHHFYDEIPMTKPQSTTQDLIEEARPDLLLQWIVACIVT